ncbi:hypothetical protein [Rubinisphaera italica]|uniref:Alpha/beta hydrolase family protein n=1 Tax=Rubinisphaera italica TaxID=2527969 RepID=A0A5C5XPL5_9PLAN|nr:hypothetical protein [Rubinisphaera italica]TWT64519.1 hypothetical protein Pan54_52830 [Rubinisphaera italica]
MNRIIHLNHNSKNTKLKPDVSDDQEFTEFLKNESREAEMTYSLSFQDARVYMPLNYEPNYAYPLIVYLQGREGSTSEYQYLMEQISTQNHLAIELDLDDKTRLSSDNVMQQIQEAVSQMSRHYNVHTERILVMGDRHRGSLAMKTVLSHPESFWGFIALNPDQSEQDCLLNQFRHLHRLRGFLHSETDNSWIQNYSRLLHDSGLNIHLDQTTSKPDSQQFSCADERVCRLIDRFIVQGIWESYSEFK